MDADSAAAVAAIVKFANTLIAIIKGIAPTTAILAVVVAAITRMFNPDALKAVGTIIGGVLVMLLLIFVGALFIKSTLANLPGGSTNTTNVITQPVQTTTPTGAAKPYVYAV